MDFAAKSKDDFGRFLGPEFVRGSKILALVVPVVRRTTFLEVIRVQVVVVSLL